MAKVYCSKCKWHWYSGIGDPIDPPAWHECRHPSERKEIIKDGWLNKESKIRYNRNPEVKNARGDCKDFEEKEYYQYPVITGLAFITLVIGIIVFIWLK